MSKKLKTLIIISSSFVAVMIIAVLILSVVGNIATIEVYNFRIFESPVIASSQDATIQTYNFYLTDQSSSSQEFMNETDEMGARILYSFKPVDESVASVSEVNGKYIINLHKVGQTEIAISRRTFTSSNNYVDNFYTNVLVNVYKELSTCDVYLQTQGTNRLPIIAMQEVSGGNIPLSTYSSNPDVAKIIKIDGNYYIEYYSEGTAIVTIYCTDNNAITDSVKINVHNNLPNGLNFVDENGDTIDNKIIYTDGQYYNINYNLIYGQEQNALVNAENIRVSNVENALIVDESATEDDFGTYNKTPFDFNDGVVLDKENRCIKLKKTDENGLFNILTFISLQTYSFDASGNEIITGTYTIPIYVYKHKVIDLEIEVSSSPVFSETHKNILNYHDDLPWENVTVSSYSKIYLTSDQTIRTFYYRVWQVWNNGDRTILNETTGGISTAYSNPGLDQFGSAPDFDYEYFKLNADEDGIVVTITIAGTSITIAITVEFIAIGDENLYSKNTETGIYTFNYFDERFRSSTEVTNSEGDITGLI